MKVALIIPSIASVKAFFIPLLKQAKAFDIDLTIITSLDDRNFKWEVGLPQGVQVINMQFPKGLNPFFWLKVRQNLKTILAQGHFDLVHAHFSMAVFLLTITPVSAVKWGTFHGVYHLAEQNLKGIIVGWLEKIAINNLDKTYVLNHHDYTRLATEKSIEKIPLPGVGVNIKAFNPANFNSEDAGNLKVELGIAEHYKVFLYVGRFTRFKGIEDAHEIFKKVQNKYSNVVLLLCGIPDKDHPLEVTKLKGAIDLGWRQDLPRLMNMADCLLFPSVREGLPVSLMEAVAMRLPYVAYNVRGVNDVHKHYGGGVLCNQGDIECMSDVVMNIILGKQTLVWSDNSLDRENFVHYQITAYQDTLLSKPFR
jgi:glycosyltransferase involved in cell wall biosynthesis